eukprot:TRINITY_DN14918_c0_g1_i1.p1 TRINITY_DN14918_c0_g1~~TRINITY_DN14918_c0_g1_i1.p1  ORF type:complete len:273 (+),score=29.98 TRINITY_DN14918_c0_g1_i1:145-963(+)
MASQTTQPFKISALQSPFFLRSMSPNTTIRTSPKFSTKDSQKAKTKSSSLMRDGNMSCTCLFIGLEGSGKTTIINSLCREVFRPMNMDEALDKCANMWRPGSVNPFPTKSVCEIVVESPSGTPFKFIDTPNVFSHRSSWQTWFSRDLSSIVFVIDFNDRLRVPLARKLLREAVSHARPGTHLIIAATRQEQYPEIDSVDAIRSFLETQSLPLPSSVVMITSDRSSLKHDINSCNELLKWILTAAKLRIGSDPSESGGKMTSSLVSESYPIQW